MARRKPFAKSFTKNLQFFHLGFHFGFQLDIRRRDGMICCLARFLSRDRGF
jgi:hypothetical protein